MRHRLVPRLFKTHRSFALMVTGLVVTHLIQAADLLSPGGAKRHSGSVWTFAHHFMGWPAWGFVHLFIGLVLLAGMYVDKKDMLLVRLGAAGTITTFMIVGISFLSADLTSPDVSWYGIASAIFIIFAALATVLGPTENEATLVALDTGDLSVLHPSED